MNAIHRIAEAVIMDILKKIPSLAEKRGWTLNHLARCRASRSPRCRACIKATIARPSPPSRSYAKLPPSLDMDGLLEQMENAIRSGIFRGYGVFQIGMAMGPDLWAAEIVLALRREFPRIRLHCCLPCETQADHWPERWRERYFDALARCDHVSCPQGRYTAGCMQRRNRAMIERSSLLIAVHGNGVRGGTASVLADARRRGEEIILIDPFAPGPGEPPRQRPDP